MAWHKQTITWNNDYMQFDDTYMCHQASVGKMA